MPNLDLLLRADDQATRRLTELVNSLKQAGVTSLKFGEQAAQGTNRADQAVRRSADAFGHLGNEVRGLLGPLIQFGSTAGFIAFMRSAVIGAEQEAEALRRLKVQVDAAGQAHLFNAKSIETWAGKLESTTRFSDGEYIQALSRAVQKTQDLASAQNLTSLSADLAVATGRDLGSTLETMALAAGGGQRGLMMLRREFPALLKDAKSAQEAISILATKFGGTAENEESLTKESAILRNQLSNLREEVGTALTPALIDLAGAALDVLDVWKRIRGIEIEKSIRAQIDETQKLIEVEASRVPQSLANAGTMTAIEQDATNKIADLNKKLADLRKKLDEEAIERSKRLGKIRTTASEEEDRAAKEAAKTAEKQNEIAQGLDAELSRLNVQHLERIGQAKQAKLAALDAERDAALKNLEKQSEALDIMNDRQMASVIATRDAIVRAHEEGTRAIEKEFDEAGQFIKEVANDIKKAFSDAFADTILSGKSFGDQMENLFDVVMKRIVSKIIESGIDKLFKAGTAGGGAGGAASGGSGFGAIIGTIASLFFQHGTQRVPGPMGAPRLAVVHGGEQVVPPGGGVAATAGTSSTMGGGVVVNMNLRVADLDPYERQKVIEALIAEIRQSTDVVREFAGELSLLQERTAGRTS